MTDGTTYNQRDIVLIPFPYSDLTGAKKRPALIISNTNLKGEDKICCLITSNTREGIQITRDAFEGNKLPFESIVKPHRIFSIHEKIINKKLTRVTKKFHEKIIEELLRKIT